MVQSKNMKKDSHSNKEKTLKALNKEKIPIHIAIIMDGNGRWAQRKGLPRFLGHRKGAERVKEIVKICRNIGVRFLTLYVFSSENWSRPAKEIKIVMVLLREFLLKEEMEFKKNKVKLVVSGKTEKLSSKTQKILERVMKETDSDSFEIVLNLALNYGGREEIVEATKKIAADVLAKKCRLSEIDEGFFRTYLYSADLPDPDLLIRTGGDMRISNFLLWQIAYTEMHITSVLWPDFSKGDLIKAVMDYQKRDRRFGGV